MPFYETAFWLDAENSTPHVGLAMNLLRVERYDEAARHFRLAIDKQRGTSDIFSYLATVQSLSGDNLGAEETIAEALRLYPLSTFVRTRYAVLLQENGKLQEAAEQFRIASQINKNEAPTWRTLITRGGRIASLEAAQNNYSPVMMLNPGDAIYAVVTEREIKHPEERVQINLFGK
jgi:predicted Zn-dependent protease